MRGLDEYRGLAFFLLALTLPSYTIVNNIILGLFVFLFLIGKDYSIKLSSLKRNWKSGMPLFLFFLLAFIAAFLINPDSSFKHIERYWSFLILPLVFLSQENMYTKYSDKFFNGITIGNIVTLLICYLNVLIEMIRNNEPLSYFFRWRHLNHQFTEIADTHPAYFGLFIVTSTIYLLYKCKWNSTLKIATIVYYSFGMIQLSSRLAIVLFISVLAISLVLKLKLKLVWPLLIGVLIGSLVLMLGSNYLKSRFSIDGISNDVRFERLQASWEVLQENPVFGVGLADIKNVRDQKYTELGYDVAARNNFNAHNQLFEYLGINGLLGGIVYLGVFFYLFFSSLKRRDYLFFTLFVIFFIANITESMLVRIKGIEYYCLITLLFISKYQRQVK